MLFVLFASVLLTLATTTDSKKNTPPESSRRPLYSKNHASVTDEEVPREATLPPPTNGYAVYTYDAEGSLEGIINCVGDFAYKVAGENIYRDPRTLKASVLNAACFSRNADAKLKAFCERKTYVWCESAVQAAVSDGTPQDMQLVPSIREFCDTYNVLAAGRSVRFVEASTKVPESLNDSTLVCSCSGHASPVPTPEDPIDGHCGNRMNCRLIGSRP